MRWRMERTAPEWHYRDITQLSSLPAIASQEASVTFINHSTTAIQIGRINILTDPIWSERASPVSFAAPNGFMHRRLRCQS